MKAGKRIARCRLCSAPAADRMRMLDFEPDEQPLCLACVRPYDQGAKATAAVLTRNLDRLHEQYERISDDACDRLARLLEARQEMQALRAELLILRADNERLRRELGRPASPAAPADEPPAAGEAPGRKARGLARSRSRRPATPDA